MDGISTSDLHGNLNALSDKSFAILLKYFKTGSLSSQEQSSLQKEITELKGTWKAVPSHDSKNLIRPAENM
tara:strand:+ start:3245 stop:3457 length:213 start_codon:yes stop_codon:yes gene_type:complete